MIYWIAHGLIAFLSKIFFPVRVYGFQNIPRNTPIIFASNHQSNLDPILIGLASSRRLSYIAKESLFKNPFFSFVLYQVGAFPIRRDSGDISAIKEALQRLNKGGRIVIFPQGTRMVTLNEAKIQFGIGLLAVKSGAIIIPVYIEGSDHVLPPGAKFFQRGRIRVSFGEPTLFSKDEAYESIARRTMDGIKALVSPTSS